MTTWGRKAYGTERYLHVFRAYALGGSLSRRQQFPPFPSASGLIPGQVLDLTSSGLWSSADECLSPLLPADRNAAGREEEEEEEEIKGPKSVEGKNT